MRWRCWPRRRSAPDLISALPDDLLLLVLARLPRASAAARTAVLSRRWRGLWARLGRIVFREVALPSVEAALGRVPRPPPAVSLLDIRVPDKRPLRRRVPKAKEHRADTAHVNSLLRLRAARAGGAHPRSPRRLNRRPPRPRLVLLRPRQLHCAFVLNLSSAIRRVPAGVEFTALKKLSLRHRTADLNALLSCFPRLRTLLHRAAMKGGCMPATLSLRVSELEIPNSLISCSPRSGDQRLRRRGKWY